jgi:hypothetical protein
MGKDKNLETGHRQHTPIILALRKLMQENHKFKASLGYKARP